MPMLPPALSVLAAIGLAAATPAVALATASAPDRVIGHPTTRAAHASTTIVDCAGEAHSTPRSLTLFCGDGNDTLAGLHWSGWGSGHATATGRDLINPCEPSCVADHDHGYRVTVSASDVKASGTAARYTRLTVTLPGARPAGTPRVERFALTAHGPVAA